MRKRGTKTRLRQLPPPKSYCSILPNNGQRIAVKVGEQIELTLGLVGGAYYGDAQISSAVVPPEGTAQD